MRSRESQPSLHRVLTPCPECWQREFWRGGGLKRTGPARIELRLAARVLPARGDEAHTVALVLEHKVALPAAVLALILRDRPFNDRVLGAEVRQSFQPK